MSDAKPRRIDRESGRNGVADKTPAVEPAALPGNTAASPSPAAPQAAPAMGAAALIEPAAVATNDPWVAFAEMQAAMARGFEEAAAEMTAMTRSGIAAVSNAGIALLGARTFAEAVEINAGLARRRVDAVLEGSTRLSEIGMKAATEASRPMLAQLGTAWSSAGLG